MKNLEQAMISILNSKNLNLQDANKDLYNAIKRDRYQAKKLGKKIDIIDITTLETDIMIRLFNKDVSGGKCMNIVNSHIISIFKKLFQNQQPNNFNIDSVVEDYEELLQQTMLTKDNCDLYRKIFNTTYKNCTFQSFSDRLLKEDPNNKLHTRDRVTVIAA